MNITCIYAHFRKIKSSGLKCNGYITNFFYKYSLILLFFISLTSDAKHFYIFNKSNNNLYVYFRAKGCFGFSGKHGCKNQKGWPVTHVCTHKYVIPGGIAAHNFNIFTGDFSIYFCLPNHRKGHFFTMIDKRHSYLIYPGKGDDFNIY